MDDLLVRDRHWTRPAKEDRELSPRLLILNLWNPESVGYGVRKHKGRMELPSDINGILYVDVSEGIEASGEELRRQLASWL